MPEVLGDLAHLPPGSHAIALYATREEAADQAVDFLSGSPEGQATSFWVGSPSLVPFYTERLEARAPEQVGCVHFLPHEQVQASDGRLRPVEEVLEFVGSHPEGVTGGADTITQYWGPGNVSEHLEYEAWFEAQPRTGSRFLCPYDIRRVPPERAEQILRELGQHHSHAVLSRSHAPAVRLLQLFLFGLHESIPPGLVEAAAWAEREDLITVEEPSGEIRMTPKGEGVVSEWMGQPLLDP
jgi:hypothetical protein